MKADTTGHVVAPIAVADLYDKLSILEIKLERIDDPAKLANVRTEFDLLDGIARSLECTRDERVIALRADPKAVNEAIWDAEVLARQIMRGGGQDEGTIASVARQTYSNNDRRAEVKRMLNLLSGSLIIEEKSHDGRSRRIKSSA